MKKIIYRQIEPDCICIDYLYDDDGIKEISGKNNTLYIVTSDGYKPVNSREYETLYSTAENIANDFTDFANGYNTYFESFKDILNYYGVKYSPRIVYKLKTWSEQYTGSLDDIADYLSITTGENWRTYTARGYCQGDFATGIYCENHYTVDSLELYVGAAAGIVTEFCRIEDGEQIYGYFIPDHVTWNNDELRRYIADNYGDDINNISIELFNGYTQVAKYMEV